MKTADIVLIVENDKEWGDIIKSLIKKNLRLSYKTTRNYQSTIRLLKSVTPLVLILDLNLGNNRFNENHWEGWQLAELAREKHIPIIIVSGYPRDDRIARAFKSFKVIDFFDKKNFDNRIPEFIKGVEGVIKKSNNKVAKDRKDQNSRLNRKTVSRAKKAGKTTYKNVFVSYSHKNRKWLDRFTPHLKVLADNNKLTIWDDTKIKSGAKWKNEIQKALSTANIALLLVSPDFLTSEFINNVELPKLFNSAEKKGLTILWVAVMPSMYEETYIAEFQSANDPSKPLSRLAKSKADEVIFQICKKVKDVAAT